MRGIFLCTQPEIDWFLHGMGHFFPQAHATFVGLIPPEERGNLLEAYCKRLFSDDPKISGEAARTWSGYEGSCLYLLPHPQEQQQFESPNVAISVGRLEAHYFRNQAFMEPDQLIRNVDRIRHELCVALRKFIPDGREALTRLSSRHPAAFSDGE